MAGKKGRSGGARKGAGRPGYRPTDLQRKQVRNFKACGVKEETIAQLIADPPISVDRLRHAFRKELDLGTPMADAEVVGSLYQQAVGTPAVYDEHGRVLRSEQPRVVAAAIWWTKARLGWTEKSAHEHSGPGGGSIPLHLDTLSDAQLDILIKRLQPSVGL